jgi:hypothetical protein
MEREEPNRLPSDTPGEPPPPEEVPMPEPEAPGVSPPIGDPDPDAGEAGDRSRSRA